MKRSAINKYIREAKDILARVGFNLPPFAFWSPEDWKNKGHEADEIRDNVLGWDITDFGYGRFETSGLLLFTIRNGNFKNPARYPKKYSEKVMIVKPEQVTPMHFHWHKREDIINRSGGNFVIELYKSSEDEQFSDESFTVSVDGVKRQCHPGERIILTPGESICLEPYVYHAFYAEKNKGTVIAGEVSDVNDDTNDNRFIKPLGRYPTIEEDEKPLHLLCTEYPGV